MSVKIKVSYESPEELEEVLELLKSLVVESHKVPRKQEGRYKRAYLLLRGKGDEKV